MISFVTRQLLFSSRAEVAPKYPNAWLVWEPGAWVAPQTGKHMTLVPVSPGNERPVQGDALCFELSKPKEAGLRLGRADDCDIVINDATVSRSHALLTPEPDGSWAALLSPTSRGALVNGAPAAAGAKVMLRRGLQLQLGEVVLTYYDPEGFLLRAEEDGKKAIRPG